MSDCEADFLVEIRSPTFYSGDARIVGGLARAGFQYTIRALERIGETLLAIHRDLVIMREARA